jgi:hypothetical protein
MNWRVFQFILVCWLILSKSYTKGHFLFIFCKKYVVKIFTAQNFMADFVKSPFLGIAQKSYFLPIKKHSVSVSYSTLRK